MSVLVRVPAFAIGQDSFSPFLKSLFIEQERFSMSNEDSDGDEGQPCNVIGDKHSETSKDVPTMDFISRKNDLISRLSSFLPQIHAANVDLINTQKASLLRIDQNLLHDEDGESELDDDDDSTDDDDENDDGENEKDDIVHLSSPTKRLKHEDSRKPATVVMNIQMNQDINHPLFQALVDTSSGDDNGDEKVVETLDVSEDTSLNLILPLTVQKPISKGGSALIHELDDQ